MDDRYRTGRLLFTLAQRLNKHTGRLGQFHAWNKCLSHILALARAHIESVIYLHFIEGVNKCSDADCRKSLKVPSSITPTCLMALLAVQTDACRFKGDLTCRALLVHDVAVEMSPPDQRTGCGCCDLRQLSW